VTYAALAASGADDPLVPGAVAAIFLQIAAMKAGSPTSRKIRAMPAWISPAVRVPGRATGGLSQAGQACRVGEGQHLVDRVTGRQQGDPAHQCLTRLLPGVLQAKAVFEGPEQRLPAQRFA